MPTKQVTGLIGSILLIIGAFTPIVKIPFIGSVNYFQNGNGDGVIILILGVASLLLVLLKKYTPLIFTGIASFGTMAFTFFNIQNKIKEMHSHLNRNLASNPFKGIAETVINTVQIEWGIAVVGIGVFLLIITPFIKNEPSKTDVPITKN